MPMTSVAAPNARNATAAATAYSFHPQPVMTMVLPDVWVGRFIYAMTSVSIPMPHQTPLV
ncbi:MAG: hypothetical protein E7046_13255 [Lentisphaerae bacterium]|nr:hypothetical protein [Lentisphaerota bacterium]